MTSRDIYKQLCIAFHSVPEGLWQPHFDPYQHRLDAFWTEHYRSGVSEAIEAEYEWIQSGKWAELSMRERYFLHIRYENAGRCVTSDRERDIPEEAYGILDGGISGRKAISRIASMFWTEDIARDWVMESIMHRSPRWVYMPDPKQKDKRY